MGPFRNDCIDCDSAYAIFMSKARAAGMGVIMPDIMLFAWMGDDVNAILLVFAVMVALVAIIVVLALKQRGL
jgi:hypothetical protein